MTIMNKLNYCYNCGKSNKDIQLKRGMTLIACKKCYLNFCERHPWSAQEWPSMKKIPIFIP